MKNIEKSEIVVAKILEKLLEFGLQSAHLEFGELELDEGYKPFFTTCCDWLIDEGLIRVDEHIKFLASGSELNSVVLTAYGFSILGQKNVLFGDKIAVGEVVKKVAESKVGYSQAGDFFGGLLGGLSKSLGS